jgi:hypothetical protein
MAGDNFARRTGGVTRIRRAGEDGPPVADASMSQIDPARSRQGPSQRTPPASRRDRAGTQARRLGNPVAPDRAGQRWTSTSPQPSTRDSCRSQPGSRVLLGEMRRSIQPSPRTQRLALGHRPHELHRLPVRPTSAAPPVPLVWSLPRPSSASSWRACPPPGRRAGPWHPRSARPRRPCSPSAASPSATSTWIPRSPSSPAPSISYRGAAGQNDLLRAKAWASVACPCLGGDVGPL